MNKPLKRTGHGVVDYVFSTALFSLPALLKLSPKAQKLAYGMGAVSTAYSMLTDYPLGLKGALSFKQHRNIDIANIATLATVPLVAKLTRERKAMGFFAAMLVIGAASALLTDWDD
jgi:hypothetical protein